MENSFRPLWAKISSFSSLSLCYVLLLWGCALVGNPQGKIVSVVKFSLQYDAFESSADYVLLANPFNTTISIRFTIILVENSFFL